MCLNLCRCHSLSALLGCSYIKILHIYLAPLYNRGWRSRCTEPRLPLRADCCNWRSRCTVPRLPLRADCCRSMRRCTEPRLPLHADRCGSVRGPHADRCRSTRGPCGSIGGPDCCGSIRGRSMFTYAYVAKSLLAGRDKFTCMRVCVLYVYSVKLG